MNGDLVWTDSVSDGGSDADDIAGAEVVAVIEDVIVANLRTHEGMPPDVITDAGTEIDQKVVRTGVACPKIDAIAGGLVSVEAGALPSNAAHEINTGFLAQARRVDSVEVEQNRAIRNAEATEITLSSFPCGIEAETDLLVKNHVGTEIHVKAALFWAREV